MYCCGSFQSYHLWSSGGSSGVSVSQTCCRTSPPIPPRWLRSADACSTAKTMRCYQEDRAPAVLAAVQSLIGGNHQVRPVRFTMIPLRPESDLKPVQGFVKTQRRKLISRIQRPGPILEALQCCRILNASEREAIAIYGACKDRNRVLVDLVLRKGEEAQSVLPRPWSIRTLFTAGAERGSHQGQGLFLSPDSFSKVQRECQV